MNVITAKRTSEAATEIHPMTFVIDADNNITAYPTLPHQTERN
jgi:hypothetical protein